MKKGNIVKIVAVVATLVLLFVISSCSVITNKAEFSVIRKFGKIEKVVSEPGLTFKTPVVETVTKISGKTRIYEIPESEVITKDKKNMVVNCFATWRVVEPVKFAKSLNSSVSSAEARIDSNVFNALKNTISSIEQNDVISGRDTALTEKIMDSISDMERYGIEISGIEIQKLDLPSANKEAVFARMISEREKIAAGYTAEGNAEYRKLKQETDKTVAINLSDANTKAEEIIAEGEREYMKIIREAYSDGDNRDFYTFRLELEAVKNSMEGEKILILPADSPLASLFVQGYQMQE